MWRWSMLTVAMTCLVSLVHADPPAPAAAVKTATSRVTGVTIYQNNALVTREVDVPQGAGSIELVVSPLPPQTVSSSLYSEGTDGVRVLTTRYRTRAVREDTREEVRKLEAQLKEMQLAGQKLQAEMDTIKQNMAMLTKLEDFTAVGLKQLTDKGLVHGETTVALATYVMDTRSTRSKELVSLQQQWQANQEQIQFTQRQLGELASRSNKTEHDAVIVVDKKNDAAGTVRLNYLVDSASWRPQYKFRGGKDKDAVQLEYLAAVNQNTGEDWSNVKLVLSTAQPMLNAAPPDLTALEVSVIAIGAPNQPPQPGAAPGQMTANYADVDRQSKDLRRQAQGEFNTNRLELGNKRINDAAALEQSWHLLGQRDEVLKQGQARGFGGVAEGPTVTYHLGTKLSIPSRNDEQVIEVARLEMAPEYFYKAVPVLTSHVYRQATFTNKSEYVLLPGEATMYIGTDYVGRTTLPLVAIGEQFTAGFGVDPQLQAQRQLVDKTRSMQGGNQVLKYEYRILISSYKPEPVKIQVWDRLPHAEAQTVAVTLVTQKPEISKDPVYVREDRPKNLLRWDLTVDPNTNGEKALAVQYEFKLELDRQMQIGTVMAK